MPIIPFLDNVLASLLHMDGADGSNVFIDEGGSPWSPHGGVTISTDEFMFGGASGLFGSASYIDTPASDLFNVGSGNFLLDMWVMRTASGLKLLCGQSNSSATLALQSMFLGFGSGNTVSGGVIGGSTTYAATSVATITADATWHYIEFGRDGNDLWLSLDGIIDGTDDVTGVTVNASPNKFAIGRYGEISSGVNFQGHVDEFHFEKGAVPHSSNFTPPAAPY